MKKAFYIFAFMVLAFMTSMLVHAGLEIPALFIISSDYAAYGDSFVWRYWWLFHGVGGKALSIGGVILGYSLGQKFWRILYVEKRRGTPRF